MTAKLSPSHPLLETSSQLEIQPLKKQDYSGNET